MIQKEHVTITKDKRVLVPESLKKLGVQFEHDVNTITFACPRFWSMADLSTMDVYINYTLPDGTPGVYEVTDVQIDEEDETLVYFDWNILRTITRLNGQIAFSICAKNIDAEGNDIHHFNTEICKTTYISPGLCIDEIVEEEYPDVLGNLIHDVSELQSGVSELSTSKAESSEVDELRIGISSKVGYAEISGTTITLYADDTKKNVINSIEIPSSDDKNTTYSFGISGNTITITPSDGGPETIELPSVTDEHIIGLINEKLGVIENGAY